MAFCSASVARTSGPTDERLFGCCPTGHSVRRSVGLPPAPTTRVCLLLRLQKVPDPSAEPLRPAARLLPSPAGGHRLSAAPRATGAIGAIMAHPDDGQTRQVSQMQAVLLRQRTCPSTTHRLVGRGCGPQGETRERALVCSPLPLPMRLSRYRLCRAREGLVETGTATDHPAVQLAPQPAGSLSLCVVPTDAPCPGGSDQAATPPSAAARSSQRGPQRLDLRHESGPLSSRPRPLVVRGCRISQS